MKKFNIFLTIILLFTLSPISNAQTQKSGTIVDIITNKGAITVLLYDETPLHRDNFIKLVKESFYNNMLYHRVINGFIIQIGDPDSRKETGKEVSYYIPENKTIPAEINPEFFHRRGVLNAARMGEAQNPYLESSPTHFTIIQGRVQTDSTLNRAEKRIQDFYRTHLQTMYTLEISKENPALSREDIQAQVTRKVEAEMGKAAPSLKIPEAHREVYKTQGGAPHLDFTYTVFGEVLSGMDVVDAIAMVPVDKERPTEEVYIVRMELRK